MARFNYTDNERRLLEILRSSRRPLSSTEVADRHYRGRAAPTHARRSVVTALNYLAGKVRANGECWRIKKTRRAGPSPVSFWVEADGSSTSRAVPAQPADLAG